MDIPACSPSNWKRLVKLSQAQWRPARGGKGEGRRPPPEKDQMRWPEKFWDLSGGLTNTRGMCWDMMHNPHQSTSININQHQLASIRSEPTFSWEKMLKDNYSTRPHAVFATSGYMLQGAHWFWGWWFLFIWVAQREGSTVPGFHDPVIPVNRLERLQYLPAEGDISQSSEAPQGLGLQLTRHDAASRWLRSREQFLMRQSYIYYFGFRML